MLSIIKRCERYLFLILVVLAIILPISQPHSIMAADEKPAMVIRFNASQVNYTRSLEKVIEATLKAKPTAFFDIVCITPKDGNEAARAPTLVEPIIQQIQYHGVAKEDIRVTYRPTLSAHYIQIQIFPR